jgi:UDP-N-acetylglucosamine/UDP-N-acetylgalactosamine diphosphorylase
MITYKGYENIIECVYSFNQEHVFQYWDKLLEFEKLELLKDLSEIDFSHIHNLYSGTHNFASFDFSPAPYITLPKTSEEIHMFKMAEQKGSEHIKQNKVAAFVVAGGQGSRLGFDGPKGKFPIGPVSGKSLFHFHAERVRASEKKFNATIPFLVMTSRDNHTDTEIFFKKNNYFALTPENVHIFPQNMIPSLDMKGKLILSEPNRIFMNPDGHGGSLTALRTSGALNKMEELGIETLSYFQVDNPLAKIIDPVFIGFHVINQAEISSKTLKKSYPEEKTGIFVRFADDTLGIVEYSDMPEEKIFARDDSGELLYSAANPAIHLFSIPFIIKITGTGDITLPYHVARKKITAFVNGTQQDIEGYKFEKFVFDALPLSKKNVILEVLREEEFAPVKNASGQDSADTAKNLMNDLNRKWLESKKITIPAEVKELEISPLFALSPDDIPEDIVIPKKEKIFLA